MQTLLSSAHSYNTRNTCMQQPLAKSPNRTFNTELSSYKICKIGGDCAT